MIRGLDNYIDKNKRKHFFIEENMNWLINSIFREYTKLVIDNSASVRTSLYLDDEYFKAIDLLIDEKHSDILRITISD